MRQVFGGPLGLILLFGLLTPAARGDVTSPGETFSEATVALESGNLEEAISKYESLVASDWHSSELYHNLGVAYQRQGKLEKSLLQLYRAWMLKPFSKSAEAAFHSVAGELNLPPSRTGLAERQVSALAWREPLALLALIAFWLGLFVFLAVRRPLLRGFGLAGVIVGILAGIAAYFMHREAPAPGAAWVIAEDAVPLRASHGQGAPSMGQLSPLSPVQISAQRENWAFVTTPDGRTGWVDANDLEPIAFGDEDESPAAMKMED